MMIGGVDLRLREVPKGAFDPHVILATVAEFWPESVFEELDDDAVRPVLAALDRDEPVRGEQFFVYRNRAKARDWERRGATPGNANDMLHFLTRATARGRALEVTLVVGELTPEMGRLYAAIDEALAQPNGRPPRPPRRFDLGAELRAVGSRLRPGAFTDLVAEAHDTLYPAWTEDELACHPHEALQFCAAVRDKVGAAVPDHVIMRALLSRHRRGTPNGQ